MEHRWGERVSVDIPIKLTARPFAGRPGRLVDVSMSGAFVMAPLDARPLSRIHVVIELPARFRRATPVLSAYIARRAADGFGIEWCEFGPQPIVELIREAGPPRSRPAATRRALIDEAAVVVLDEIRAGFLRSGT
jgi:hypothetical protein